MKNLFILGIVSGMAAVAATPAVKDAFAPATGGNVHLAGRAGESADACIRARAYSDWARGAMYEECVNAFRTHWDDRVGWQNEYWGKTMLCYAGAAMYTGDPALKAWIVEKTHAFLKEFQKPNGYLSTYSKEDFLRNHPEDPDAKKHWCFNIWGRKYTFWALIDIYRATGDKAALDGAVKMADHLIAQLKRLGLTLDKTGAWNGISSMSILRPVLELYHITGNPAYLALCKDIVRAMDAEPANPGRIIRDAFRKEKIYTWYPEAAFWAKAYETQSCLEGLVDYYRTTGEKRVLDAVLAYHKHLMDEELNPMRSAGYFDHFLDARHHVNGMTELCDVTHWIRLNRELLLLTGDAKYADIIEEAFYNAFLAGVWRDGRWGAHIIRSHGTRHLSAPPQTGMFEHQCCPDNMMRTYFDFANSVGGVAPDGAVMVALYSDATANLPGAQIVISGGYPYADTPVTVKVTREKAGKVRFRIPRWSKTFQLNGQAVTAKNGWSLPVRRASRPRRSVIPWTSCSTRCTSWNGTRRTWRDSPATIRRCSSSAVRSCSPRAASPARRATRRWGPPRSGATAGRRRSAPRRTPPRTPACHRPGSSRFRAGRSPRPSPCPTSRRPPTWTIRRIGSRSGSDHHLTMGVKTMLRKSASEWSPWM